MPIKIKMNPADIIPVHDMKSGQIGVIVEAVNGLTEYNGHIVMKHSDSKSITVLGDKKNHLGNYVDSFGEDCPHKVRLFQEGESFTFTY